MRRCCPVRAEAAPSAAAQGLGPAARAPLAAPPPGRGQGGARPGGLAPCAGALGAAAAAGAARRAERRRGRAAARAAWLQGLLGPLASPVLAPAAEERLLGLLGRGSPEEEVLACAGELEGLRGQAAAPEAARGRWELRLASSSKFDLAAPLGRRVDGSAPGLEAVAPAVLGALGAEGEAAPASSSPIQRLVTGLFRSAQVITEDRVDTLVELGDVGSIRLSAAAEVDSSNPARINFTFDLGYFLVFGLRIPYPVPFKLLGDEAKGWLENTYASDRVRICRGNKGTVFVLTRATADAEEARAPRPNGGAVVVLPGLGNDSGDYGPLLERLSARGFAPSVVPVARIDWLRNALGLLDVKYWLGTLEPRPVLDWYLERVELEVEAAHAASGGAVVLLGHSAGGWLARCYLGGRGAGPEPRVRKLVTLGTPHLPPAEGSEGAFDQTRGLLTYVQQNYRGLPPGVAGASVGSKLTLGRRGLEDLGAFVVGVGYKQVCGDDEVWGDGIVPLQSMRVPDWQWRELGGVWHSPLGAAGREWYGDDAPLDEWIDLLR